MLTTFESEQNCCQLMSKALIWCRNIHHTTTQQEKPLDLYKIAGDVKWLWSTAAA